MSPLSPGQVHELARLRQSARRLKANGRGWYLRSVLLMVVAGVAGYRGGQMNNIIGIVMVVLATMAFSLGRSLRRQGTIMEERIDLMEHTTSEHLGEIAG